MKASTDWLAWSAAEFSAGPARLGCMHLQNYSARYREWGESTPLVLIPGLAGGFDLLAPIARMLQPECRVISYQLRGEDDFFALRRRFELKDLADDLAEFLDQQGLEAPAVMGVSFGGALALEFATRHPGRVSKLIVQGAASRFEKNLLRLVAGVVLSQYPLPPDNPFVNQFFNLLFGARQRSNPLFDFATRQCWQTDQSVMAYRFRLIEQFDIRDRLARIQAPALVLAGDRDILVSEQILSELMSGLPDGRLVRLRGCGHLAFLSHPSLVANAVTDFLTACVPT